MALPLAEPLRQPPFRTLRTGGYAGSPDSLALMRRAVRDGESHPEVRRWAASVVRGVEPRDYLSEAAAIHYETARRVRYLRDPAHTEFVEHPAVILQQRVGDCDGMATLIATGRKVVDADRAAVAFGAALASAGHEVQFVAAGFKPPATAGPDPYSHVFVRVRDPKSGEWAVLDPVAGPRTREMLRKVTVLRGVPT